MKLSISFHIQEHDSVLEIGYSVAREWGFWNSPGEVKLI